MVGRSMHVKNIGTRGTQYTGGGGGQITGLGFYTKPRYMSTYLRKMRDEQRSFNLIMFAAVAFLLLSQRT